MAGSRESVTRAGQQACERCGHGQGGALLAKATRAPGARDRTARRQKAALESTSEYWRIWYYLLEAAGLDVRAAPGQPKSDQLDCVGQPKCTEARMLLDQTDALTAQTTRLTIRIEELFAAIPGAQVAATRRLASDAPEPHVHASDDVRR